MTEKQKKNPVVPDRYVNFHGDPITKYGVSLKQQFSRPDLLAALLLGPALYLCGQRASDIIIGGVWSLIANTIYRIGFSCIEWLLFKGRVIDTKPESRQEMQSADLLRVGAVQSANVGMCIATSIIAARNIDDPMLYVPLAAWGVKRVMTAQKVLSGEWALVSRGDMKREAPKEQENLQPATAAQLQPIQIRPEHG